MYGLLAMGPVQERPCAIHPEKRIEPRSQISLHLTLRGQEHRPFQENRGSAFPGMIWMDQTCPGYPL